MALQKFGEYDIIGKVSQDVTIELEIYAGFNDFRRLESFALTLKNPCAIPEYYKIRKGDGLDNFEYEVGDESKTTAPHGVYI